MSIKTYQFVLGIGVFVLCAVGFVRLGSALGSPSDGSVSAASDATNFASARATVDGGVQHVTLSYGGSGRYNPSVVRVKKDVPVEIALDTNSLGGCMSVLVIPDLGVQGGANDPGGVVRFTPTRTGTFAMRCPMGMVNGTLIVEN